MIIAVVLSPCRNIDFALMEHAVRFHKTVSNPRLISQTSTRDNTSA